MLSVYEAFFAGGARALHTAVVRELHTSGSHRHSVLGLYREVHRESLRQRMTSDSRYQALRDAGIRAVALRRSAADRSPFTAAEMVVAARHAARADVVLSLKEQPLRLVNQEGFPARPLVVCLHRSDPEHQGGALADLLAAIAAGRVASVVCCAESTRAAYRAAGVPASLLTVIPNGVDLARYRPVSTRARGRLRRSLGLPASARVVVFAARYDGMKNVPLFLAAARDFLARHEDAHVLMCGAGMSLANTGLCVDLEVAFDDRPDLLRRLHTLGVREDMPDVFAVADVVALTSSTGEAAPLCLIEGMMCGAVPVTTDVGDSAAIVAGHGLVVEPDAAVISAAWDEAVARRAEWAPALLRDRPRFSHTRMAAAYAAVIDRVGDVAPAGARRRR
ncbi:glycosyltransferase [Luedemannella flava]|uniref:glycosyltransferase n=1 Tax=Luedemannella flava TaxID=349316 RepID=UPI0031D13251